jgi:hypothetical protein
VGSFGAVFDLNETLAFIADEPAFWIRAKVWWRDIAAAPMRWLDGFQPLWFQRYRLLAAAKACHPR